ncbi:MAG TPA: asparagine synthase-related protein [Pyrinomonadaceae bacterium]|nr:asparagine synthase-related protein [Pyrinomonadaceae bacterium]
MSTLGGICNFDGRVVSKQTLLSLADTSTRRESDGDSHARIDTVGMIYRAFHTNRESRLEKQPLVTHEGHILTWDGRLDNRDELLTQIRIDTSEVNTDVTIVMGAYHKWGVDFPLKLIGDFALALYDSHARTLILARDPIGTRTLFYDLSKHEIRWSSDLKPLLLLSPASSEIDEEYVTQFLIRSPGPDRSPYKHIRPVPPGHALVIRHGNARLHRFWSLDPQQRLRYKTDAEYEEHYRSLFHEAVKCRLRVDGPVWAELSGGLDSSSIVCVAHHILHEEEVQATNIETVSYVSDECSSADERTFIRDVEERLGIAGHHMKQENYQLFARFDGDGDIVMPNVLHCFANRYQALQEAILNSGARVLLTGQGGDEVNCSQESATPLLADLLKECKLIKLHKTIQLWSQVYKTPYVQLFWEGLQPLLPTNIQSRLRPRPQHQVPSWFHPSFVSRLNVRERMLGTTDVFGFSSLSGRDQSVGFLSAVNSISAGSLRERYQLEVSHPYLHRPLVEFLQAIPYEQRVRPGEARSVMRRALLDLLPERIAKRRSKGGIDEVLYRALAQEWPRLRSMFETARVASHGYVDKQALIVALDRARHGYEPQTAHLFRTIALEFWLRALELQRGSKVRSAA